MRGIGALLLAALLWLPALAAQAADDRSWDEIVAAARGQTVYFHAWAGDRKVNAYIRWAAEVMDRRFDITLNHVKTDDTGNVVSALLAEKAAGRRTGGRADLLWINGENFHALKDAGLLHGPFTERLPNFRLVDTEDKPATVTDFALPVEGYESPWGYSQLTFYYDSARVETPPRSSEALLDWARDTPGRFTYPAPPDFLGVTFLKQLLIERVADRSILKTAPDDASFDDATQPVWAYLDALTPHLWRRGRGYPANGPMLRQLLNDGEIDIAFAFNPAEAASSIAQGLLPDSVRSYVLDGGTIANAHFLAIPFNSGAKDAAMVTANFLLSPEAQARKADPRVWGDPTVLDLERLSAADARAFADLPRAAAAPDAEATTRTLAEPHPDWTLRLERAWLARYGH